MKNRILLTSVTAITALLFLTGCGNATNESTNSKSSESSTASKDKTSSSSVASDSSTNSSKTLKDVSYSVEDAIKAYQEAYPQTDITKIESDQSFGVYYFKVEGMDDSTEYEISINTETGAVEKKPEEKLDSDEQNGAKRNKDKLDLNDLVQIKDAIATAEKQATSGEVTEWELSKELQITYWEITIKDGSNETTVKIDAHSGDILETEMDD